MNWEHELRKEREDMDRFNEEMVYNTPDFKETFRWLDDLGKRLFEQERRRRLLKHRDVDVSIQNDRIYTALMLAATEGHEKVVDRLLEDSKIDVNLQNEYGKMALMLAANRGHEKDVDRLLQDSEVSVNLQDSGGYTALMWAAIEGHEKVVDLLLRREYVDVNIQNDYEETALMLEGHQKKAMKKLSTFFFGAKTLT